MKISKIGQRGFTLTELMVSVALMLVLVGAVALVFRHSSEVFSVSEAKMSVYQNARAALELIARELASADNTHIPFEIANNAEGSTNPVLKFQTTTYWISGTTRENGTATVEYYLQQVTNRPKLWNLMRKVTPTSGLVTDNILAQYLPVSSSSWEIGYFKYNSDTSNWDYVKPTSRKTFSQQTNPKENLPDAIRIKMNVTDMQNKVVRTLSRTIWIPRSSS